MLLAGIAVDCAAEPVSEETELLAEIARDIADLARQEKALYAEIKALSDAERKAKEDMVCTCHCSINIQ